MGSGVTAGSVFLATRHLRGNVLKMGFAVPWAGQSATKQVLCQFSGGRIGVLQRSKELIIGSHMGILVPLQVAEE